MLECITPFKWTFFISHGNFYPFICLHSDTKYKKNYPYRIYELEALCHFLSVKKNLINIEDRELYEKSKQNEVCYIHRWNEFSRQIIIFHVDTAKGHFDNYKLKNLLFKNDDFISQKFISYFMNYQQEIYQHGDKVFSTLSDN